MDPTWIRWRMQLTVDIKRAVEEAGTQQLDKVLSIIRKKNKQLSGKSENSPKELNGKEMGNIDTVAALCPPVSALQSNPVAEYMDCDEARANKDMGTVVGGRGARLYNSFTTVDHEQSRAGLLEHVKSVTDNEVCSLLNLGTCGLHVVHGSLRTGVESVDWDISSLLRHMYYLFTDSPTRRALFTQLTGCASFSIEVLWCAVELDHANIINDVLAENAKKEYLHFRNLKKSQLQEIFRPCDQFSDEVGLAAYNPNGLPSLVAVNTVGRLQEMAQAKKWKMPLYQERGTINSLQCVKCTFQGITTEGWSTTKKEAKKQAAAEMLAQLIVSQSVGSTSPLDSPITSTSTTEITNPTIVDALNLPVSDHLIDLGITTDNEAKTSLFHLMTTEDSDGEQPANSEHDSNSIQILVKPIITMSSNNSVGELQEYCMQHGISMPSYQLTMESGPPHNKTFTITCQVEKHTTKGTSNSKKDAKKKAAILMTPLVMNCVPATQLPHEVSTFLQNGPQEQLETDYCGSFQNSYPEVSQQRPNAGTENLDLVEEDDYKSNLGSGNTIGILQEICQRMKWEMPVYIGNDVSHQGQSIRCTLRGKTSEGFNINKKDAKKIAAGKMLALLNRSGERFTSSPAKSNPTYASEHPSPINKFVSNSDIKSVYSDQSHSQSTVNTICDSLAPKTVEDSTSKIPPDLAKVIELYRSLTCTKTSTISSKPDMIEQMHLKFQFQGVILNEIVQAFDSEEQDDIDYLLLLEKLSKEQHFTMQFKECDSLDPIVNFSPNASEGRYSPTLNSSLTAPLKNIIFNSFTHSSSQTAEHSKDCDKGCDTRLLNVYTIFISNRICLEFGGFERFLWDIVTVAGSVSSGDLKDIIHVRNQVEDCIFNTIAKLSYLQGAQVGVMKDCDVTKVVTESLAIFSPGEISQWVSLYTAGQIDYPSYKPIRSDGTAGFPLTNQTILGSGSPWASHFTVTFSFSFALCTTDVSMKEVGSGDKRVDDTNQTSDTQFPFAHPIRNGSGSQTFESRCTFQ
uniref:DRBM domain-containing protein n=1 Tax=Timema monikensis TaxID=170555 RepID=A0A7R9E0T0_9NEOP|nr:unnamed protein product [Timema monikensis]